MSKWRLLIRLLITGAVFYLYACCREVLRSAAGFKFAPPLTLLHIIWALLMLNMLWRLLPASAQPPAAQKQFARYFYPQPAKLNRPALAAYVGRVNRRARRVLALWCGCHALLLPLRLSGIVGPPELIVLFSLYFLADAVCMLYFCPFQQWLIKCRCCIDCRIFEWSHFMMFTPLLFFGGWFSYSLLIMTAILTLRWEINFARHPERFWPGANNALCCANCRAKHCRKYNSTWEIFGTRQEKSDIL